MVLESLFSPQTAERTPWKMFFMGFLFASIGIFLSIWIFREHSSLVMVFLTVLVCVPLMYNTVKYEEQRDVVQKRVFVKEHGRAISFFIFLFMGFVVAYSLWYIFLPENLMINTFGVQTDTIRAINQQISGSAFSATNILSQILLNNVKVLFFCIFFAFFYGAGAIFILTWNASVIAAAVGNFVRNDIAGAATSIGLVKIGQYFATFSLGLLRYSIHGIPEVTAYFAGGLAGGIISVAMIKHDFMSDTFKKVVKDSFHLLGLAVLLLLIAAFTEVYITPMFF